MRKYFALEFLGYNGRFPPVSRKVLEYFECFVETHVLQPKKIVVGTKWGVGVRIHFSDNGPKVLFKDMALVKGWTSGRYADPIKIYTGIILNDMLMVEDSQLYRRTIEVIYQMISLFFTTYYKKVKPEYLRELWSRVDLAYLETLPYPAPLAEQYVGLPGTPF